MSRQADAVQGEIEQKLVAPLGALGLDVEAVELTPAGRRRVLRVALDGDDGVTLDDVAEAARTVSRVLEEAELMGEQPYTLEVSSRGVDRPLTLPRHWRRNAGRLVNVQLHDGSSLTGRIGSSDDYAVTLDVGGEPRRAAYAEVAKAMVQIEFNRPKANGEAEED